MTQRHGKPRALFVCHIGGGGTEKHLRELAEVVADRCETFLLKPADHRALGPEVEGRLHLQPLSPAGPDRFFDPSGQLEELEATLEAIGFDRAHLHHLLGIEEIAKSLLDSLGLPFDLTLHDYYLLSPSYILCGADGFHGEPDVGHDEAERVAAASSCTLREWRDRRRWFFDRAERVIVPSLDAQKRVGRYFDTSKIIAAYHPDLAPPLPLPSPRTRSDGGPSRVLTLGEVYPHKGARILFEAAQRAAREGLPLEFHHLGTLPEHEHLSAGPRLKVHGVYRDSELPGLIAELDPDVAWFPARWPETYSYTLSAALRAGLPIVAPRIGAFPERLGGRAWTWIAPWDLKSEASCELLLSVRERLLARHPPTPPAIEERALESFYPEAYLAPLARSTTR